MSKLKMISRPLMVALLVLGTAHILASESAHAKGAQWWNARAEAIGGRSNNRGSALRQCNDKVEKLKEYTWGVYEVEKYRACMAEHRQPE